MSHLSLEMLARLVDEAPTALEAAHLAACDACRAELQQLHAQTSALAVLPELEPPALEWQRIERRLAAEGLIPTHRPRRAWLQVGMSAAAALALLATGTLLGRTLAAPEAAPLASAPAQPAVGTPPGAMAPAAAEPVVDSAAETPAPAQLPVTQAPVRLASADVTPRAPRTTEEALEQLRVAEQSYLDALTRFAEFSGNTAAGDPAARLAALEGIVLTTRAALGQAPTDPVINGYHLTALAQRDATLRQIASVGNESWF